MTTLPTHYLSRHHLGRLAPALFLVVLGWTCLARPAFAADPIDANAAHDMSTMDHSGSGHDTNADAGVPDMDGMDHGTTMDDMDHSEHAGMRAGASAGADAPAALARTSADGLYRVELRNLPEPVPLNRMHEWVVHVEAADGTPVTGASIAMDGGMPIHDHGLPTAPRVTAELGNGDYRLEGVRFQMPGHWVVELAIDAAPGVDSVAFDLNL